MALDYVNKRAIIGSRSGPSHDCCRCDFVVFSEWLRGMMNRVLVRLRRTSSLCREYDETRPLKPQTMTRSIERQYDTSTESHSSIQAVSSDNAFS
jgi:hypothetical protein